MTLTKRLIFLMIPLLLNHCGITQSTENMSQTKITNIQPLGFTWEVVNPFLFCAHHRDHYPAGNDQFGPVASLAGRDLGQDFTLKDGFRMYHGRTVPGFPEHPHRGFETVTIVLEGFVDHSDSHGQAGRYGMGDVQWMTAGSGLQHCEMFPLLNKDKDNPLELFQVWLNLPKAKKFVNPHFKMLWNEKIPVVKYKDDQGKTTQVKIIAGHCGDTPSLAPAPDSYAAEKESAVAIWIVTLEPGAKWTMPLAPKEARRMLYFYKGDTISVDGQNIAAGHSFELVTGAEQTLVNGTAEGSILVLQGKPIDEPVVQYGPFVMNTDAEIRQAFADYRETQFGGWPWDRSDYVHPRDAGRFARYLDGTTEKP
jgi:redox-sensitive bicupin YhaK (pirin superfamily)